MQPFEVSKTNDKGDIMTRQREFSFKYQLPVYALERRLCEYDTRC